MIPKTKPEDLVKAVRIISEWFDEQAANSVEDATHWDNVIRARALDEAADEIERLRAENKMLLETLVACGCNCSGSNRLLIRDVLAEIKDSKE